MRRLLLAIAMSALFAPSAAAGVPSPNTSLVPPLLTLGASDGSAPDPALAFVIQVRDLNNIPISGSVVQIDFTRCPDVLLGTLAGPGTIVNCDTRKPRLTTGSDGRVEFRLTGAIGIRSPASTGAQAWVLADGLVLARVPVAVLDQDGAEGVDAKDLRLWLHDFYSGTNPARSDLDGNSFVSPSDLMVLLDAAGRASQEVSAPRCDAGAVDRPSVPEGALELSWRDCIPGGGVSLETFACASNTGSNLLVAAARLSQARSDVLAFEAELELFAPTAPVLPEYWHLEPTGCSETRDVLQVEVPEVTCESPWNGLAVGGITRVLPSAGGDPRRTIVRVMGAVPEGVAIDADALTSLFQLRFTHTRTVGANACSGCTTPVALWLRSVRLARGAGGSGTIAAPDLELAAPATASTAFWQAVTGVVPTQRASWGRIKTTYR